MDWKWFVIVLVLANISFAVVETQEIFTSKQHISEMFSEKLPGVDIQLPADAVFRLADGGQVARFAGNGLLSVFAAYNNNEPVPNATKLVEFMQLPIKGLLSTSENETFPFLVSSNAIGAPEIVFLTIFPRKNITGFDKVSDFLGFHPGYTNPEEYVIEAPEKDKPIGMSAGGQYRNFTFTGCKLI